MLPGLHRGSRSETAAETFCELLAGIGGHDLRWETASDQRRPFLHLVFAGAALRPARHARVGIVDDLAIAPAKAYSATSRVWICRSGRQGQAERVIGAASEGAAKQSARVSCPKWGRRMARNPAHQEDCLIPAGIAASSDGRAETTIRGCTTHPNSEQFWEDLTYGVATYRRPHLCVVRRHQRQAPARMHWRRLSRGDQRLLAPASDRRRHSGRLRADTDGRDAPPASEVAACNDCNRISSLRVANR